MSVAAQTIHATAVAFGGTGVLIRGESGAGKSTLARQLLTYAQHEGSFARLISDDRVRLTQAHGRVVANSIPAIEGQLEVRGQGIMPVPFLSAAVIDVVVDLDISPQRFPEECDKMTILMSSPLPCIALKGISDRAEHIIWFIAQRASSEV